MAKRMSPVLSSYVSLQQPATQQGLHGAADTQGGVTLPLPAVCVWAVL